MSPQPAMATYSARLESFVTARIAGKSRSSNAKNSKAIKWPHKSPSTDQLAKAGFYYDPSASSPDNVTCFGCTKSLDGWEPNDDPVQEHIAYSSECGVAILADLDQQLEAGNRDFENPMSQRMIEARKATFGDMWPHEKKRGWVCKTQKMAEAGWYYCPTHESDDFVKCVYCHLGLDGWEPKDNPFEEHLRRSAECDYFMVGQIPERTTTKSKKGRTSKASQLSEQSLAASALESSTMHGNDVDADGDSIMTTNTEAATSLKNAGKAKRGRGKGRTTRAQEYTAPEPGDSGFEVRVAEEPKRTARGKKRTSDEIAIEIDDETAPPAKRRVTRDDASTARSERLTISRGFEDTHVSDIEYMHLTDPIKSAKTRQRASSTTRKASSTTRKASSTTRKASSTIRKAPSATRKAPPATRKASSTTRKASNVSTASKAPLESTLEADDTLPPSQVEAHKVPASSMAFAPRIEAAEGTDEKADELTVASQSVTPKKSSPAGQIPSPTPSLQSSDAENQPPSSRPSTVRPPLASLSPNKQNTYRVRLAGAGATTPSRSRTAEKSSNKLETNFPWSTVDIEEILLGSPAYRNENGFQGLKDSLAAEEKNMTVEEWILQNARKGEERLREECERIVGQFESEGVRALKALEGLVTTD